jgi:hypothetical protein
VTPVSPTPPSGTSVVTAPGVSQAPASARREERARKHASQSAFAIRPAGTSDEWFYALVGGATVLTLLLAAAGIARMGPRPRPLAARAWVQHGPDTSRRR